jgi:Diaminopimelate decarboxylase
VDIGGGLGIPYRPEEDTLNIDAAAEGIVREMKKGIEEYDIGKPELRLEPGRYLTAEAGHLISRVTGVKHKDTEYVGLDTGMHQILRPSLLDSYHEIRKVEKKDNPEIQDRTVVGQVCSSIDVIAEERELPELEQGDLVSIEDVGAYGFVMASHWNSRPLPAEVLVGKNGVELIRERQNKEQIFHGTFLDD